MDTGGGATAWPGRVLSSILCRTASRALEIDSGLALCAGGAGGGTGASETTAAGLGAATGGGGSAGAGAGAGAGTAAGAGAEAVAGAGGAVCCNFSRRASRALAIDSGSALCTAVAGAATGASETTAPALGAATGGGGATGAGAGAGAGTAAGAGAEAVAGAGGVASCNFSRRASRALEMAAESPVWRAGGAPWGWERLCCNCWRKASRAFICAGVSFPRTTSVAAQAVAQATSKLLEICIPAFYVKAAPDATR